jgi:hypothetical protein
MTKIMPEHLARSAFVYVLSRRLINCCTTTRAAIANTDWRTARVSSDGKR